MDKNIIYTGHLPDSPDPYELAGLGRGLEPSGARQRMRARDQEMAALIGAWQREKAAATTPQEQLDAFHRHEEAVKDLNRRNPDSGYA